MDSVATMSPEELRREVVSLSQRLQGLRRASGMHDETGLLDRPAFLERGAAELRRARRYDRALGLVVVRALPAVGESDGERAFAIADLLRAVLRDGIDQPGRLERSVWGVLLPETTLGGALAVTDRLRLAAGRVRLPTRSGTLRLSLACAADALLVDDGRFKDVLDRASEALARSLGDGPADA